MRIMQKELLCWVSPNTISHPEQLWTNYVVYTITHNVGKKPISCVIRDENISYHAHWHDWHMLMEGGTGTREQYYGWQFYNCTETQATLLVGRFISGTRVIRPILFFEG